MTFQVRVRKADDPGFGVDFPPLARLEWALEDRDEHRAAYGRAIRDQGFRIDAVDMETDEVVDWPDCTSPTAGAA